MFFRFLLPHTLVFIEGENRMDGAAVSSRSPELIVCYIQCRSTLKLDVALEYNSKKIYFNIQFVTCDPSLL